MRLLAFHFYIKDYFFPTELTLTFPNSGAGEVHAIRLASLLLLFHIFASEIRGSPDRGRGRGPAMSSVPFLRQ